MRNQYVKSGGVWQTETTFKLKMLKLSQESKSRESVKRNEALLHGAKIEVPFANKDTFKDQMSYWSVSPYWDANNKCWRIHANKATIDKLMEQMPFIKLIKYSTNFRGEEI